MPNRECDFCSSDYKTDPSVGYYKLSNFMRIKLELNTVRADFICGLHFSPSAFSENGRLKPNATLTFFPSQASFELDLPYYSKAVKDKSRLRDTITSRRRDTCFSTFIGHR